MRDLTPIFTSSRIIAQVTQSSIQVTLAILALCLILIFDISIFLYRPYDGMAIITGYSGEVSAIYNPGPAYSAGIKVGDHLIAVNSIAVDPWLQRPLYPVGLLPGNQVIYQVERNGSVFSISMKLGSYTENGSLLSAIIGVIILSFAFWLIGLLLCLFAPLQDTRARLVGLCWLLAGIAAAAGGPGTQSHFWGAGTTLKVSWAFIGFAVIAANLYFPFPAFSSAVRNRTVNVATAIAVVIAVINLIDDFILKSFNISLANFGLPTNRLVYAWFFIATISSIFLLVRSHFRSQDAEARRQTGIILWAMVIGFGPFFVLTLMPLLLFGDQAHTADGAYTSLFLALIPLAYAYVIHQRKLLRIDAIVNRLVVFFILIVSILLVSFTVLGMISFILKLPPQLPLMGSLAAAVVALPSIILEKRVQVQVNRILYGTYYDHATITTNLSSQLARTMDRKTLNELLIGTLPSQMGVEKGALFLVEKDGFRLQGSTFESELIPNDDELIKTLQNIHQPIRGLNLWGLLSESSETHWESINWGQVFIPILFQEEMVGLLILGGRPGGDVYSAQDIAILGTAAHQAALAVANIQLVDNLRGLNRRLVYSEEERRKAIARELHDSILQDLFFIKNRLSKAKSGNEFNEYFDRVIERLRMTIQEQRPNLLNTSLPLALESLAQQMEQLAGENGPCVTWNSKLYAEVVIPDEIATQMYRIAQEAMTNALKHSNASIIKVSLEEIGPGTIELRIQDDGVGLMESLDGRNGACNHFGVDMMKERAAMINGHFRIESKPNQGTLIELKVSYK